MPSALIVDDNVPVREAIAHSLARQAWDVTTAADGLEGLEAVRSRLFDAVITDVQMPGQGDLWLWAEALKLRPDIRGKFVFMSSEPLPEPPDGAVFLVKPLSLATLKSEIESILQRRNGTQAANTEAA
jgi:two-component system cell cycle sensor histidine kinase/response regulator CckA